MAVRQRGEKVPGLQPSPISVCEGSQEQVHLRSPEAGTWAVHTLPNSLARRLPGREASFIAFMGFQLSMVVHTPRMDSSWIHFTCMCVFLNSKGQLWAGLCVCLSQGSRSVGLGGKVLEPSQGFVVYSTAGACLLGQLVPPGEKGV